MQLTQLDLHMLAQLLVEGRKRLVHQHDARLKHHGTGQRHALALAARKLIHAARAEATQSHHLQRPLNATGRFGRGDATQFKRKGDIGSNRHMRKQGVVLKNHAQFALVRRHGDHFLVAKLQAAAIGSGKPGEHRQKRGFA